MNYLIDLIIRPERNCYNNNDIGDKVFSFNGEEFKRTDYNSQVNKF
jgi:hypothetical protein